MDKELMQLEQQIRAYLRKRNLPPERASKLVQILMRTGIPKEPQPAGQAATNFPNSTGK